MSQPELSLPDAPAVASPHVVEQMVEKQHLEWLAPLFKDGNTKRLITPKAAAAVHDCSTRHIYELLAMGKLETLKVNHDYRITKRSLMIHLWESWSGRHNALPDQVLTFLLLLLGHLPVRALQTIRDTCAHLMARKAAAEHSLGLNQPRTSKRPQIPKLPLD